MHASSLLCSLLALTAVHAYSYEKHIEYSIVKGVFQQDDDSTDASAFDFIASNFGLIKRTYPSDASYPDGKQPTQWQHLAHYITTLNSGAMSNEQYKLFFIGRHGEGFHNAAESYFGTPAWNCYWSERDGNGTVTWADAKLTTTGIQQATKVNKFWASLIQAQNITPPESYYTSPLYRCLDTARLTFAGLHLPHRSPFVVKENLREGISAHTCDRRSTKSYIERNFPTFTFESGFPEEDPYWTELYAEPREWQDARSKDVLDEMFREDENTYISITSHSGEIASLLRILNHRTFSLSTGSAIPVLVKATTISGADNLDPTLPYSPQKTCAVPPAVKNPSCNDCSCCN